MKNPLSFRAGWISAAFVAFSGVSSEAAIVYASAGSSYSQNFNSLAASGASNAWANDSTLAGWHAVQTGATPSSWSVYQAANGSAAQGALLSIGTGTNSDRALGGQNANTTAPAVTDMLYALQVTNSTGGILSSFTLGYTLEQWRFVQNEIVDKMTLQYQVFSAGSGSITAASGWTTVASLSPNAPVVSSAASAAIDGNASGNRVSVADTVAVSWDAGSELWLRWVDTSSGINAAAGATRAMFGIDDVSFSAVPEPSAMLLGGLGLIGLLRRRRG